MNLWAVRIERKSHNKEILSAKILDVDSMKVTDMGGDLLIDSMLHGNIKINNLTLEDTEDGHKRVILDKYAKTLQQYKARMFFYRSRRGTILSESFAIVLRGYSAVYEFIADNPFHKERVMHIVGTADDLREAIRIEAAQLGQQLYWDYSLYNGLVTDRTWAHNSDRKKIAVYETDKDKYDDMFNEELETLAKIRISIPCKFCILTMTNGMLTIDKIKFDADDIEIPEGIEAFGRSFGGAYSIIMPTTLKMISAKAFTNDSDILQLTFKNALSTFPKYMCAGTNIQVLEYPKNTALKTIQDGAFQNCEDLNLDFNLICESIESKAFLNSGIKQLGIRHCTNMYDKAFKDCIKLKEVVIIDTSYIGQKVFSGCEKLKTVKIGNESKSNIVISAEAFLNCTKLNSVIINGKAVIRENAFKNCKALKTIKVSRASVIEPGAIPRTAVIEYT